MTCHDIKPQSHFSEQNLKMPSPISDTLPHLITYSFTHSLIHLFTYLPLIHWVTHFLTHFLTHSFTHIQTHNDIPFIYFINGGTDTLALLQHATGIKSANEGKEELLTWKFHLQYFQLPLGIRCSFFQSCSHAGLHRRELHPFAHKWITILSIP